jgi:sugar transferase (PEP-CTERM system associated)
MALGQQLHARTLLLIGLDATLIVAAVSAAAWLRVGPEFARSVLTTGTGLSQALIIAGTCQLCLYFADLYDLRVVADRRELFVRLLESLAAASILLAMVYFWFPQLMVGRGIFVLTAVLVIAAMLGWRFLFEWLAEQVPGGERLLLVGTTPATVALAQEILERRAELGVEIVGFVDHDPGVLGAGELSPGVIGTFDDIPAIVRDQKVDRVVVSLADARGRLPMDRLLEIKLGGVTFDHLATVYERYTGKIAVENLRPSWLIFSEGFRKSAFQRATKRLLDVSVSTVGLILAMPILVTVSLLVKITSRGPVFYAQERVGLDGQRFKVLKLRSMRVDAEAATGPVWAQHNDARVTPIGGLLRRTRLDELPQLWNVMRGDMSFVGPRPERPYFVEQLASVIPFYMERHAVKPGVTGWAQVKYRYGASVEDAMEKLRYDLYYIKHLSIVFDFTIVMDTVKVILSGKGAK